jgi:8-oxo-dGTP diphosphatase
VHFNSRQLARTGLLEQSADLLRAASAHDPVQLRRAQQAGLDFCVLSPVLPTPSHPDAEPLGWDRFRDWVAAVNLPVYALGGMRPDCLEPAWQAGAQGIAGIRGLYAAR